MIKNSKMDFYLVPGVLLTVRSAGDIQTPGREVKIQHAADYFLTKFEVFA